MEAWIPIYIAAWTAACVGAAALCLTGRAAFGPVRREYLTFLFVPWKLWTFAVAAGGLTVMAPYTGDPTWDYVDSLFMSVTTFLSAPWAAGVIYRALRGPLKFGTLYVAVCTWLFSASWSYDLYIFLRDGVYPATWWANLCASSVLYLSAGLFWNLEWTPERGVQ